MEQFPIPAIPGIPTIPAIPDLGPLPIPDIPDIPGLGDFGGLFESFFESYLDLYAQLLADLDLGGIFDFYAQLFADLDPALFPDVDTAGLAALLEGLDPDLLTGLDPEFVAGFDPEALVELISGFTPEALEALLLGFSEDLAAVIEDFDIPALIDDLVLGGWTVGDPHLQTFDGVGYSFQAAGEFVLARETGGAGFELQARFAPAAGSDLVSVTAAVAARLSDGTAVEIDAQSDAPLTVGGTARALADGAALMVGDDVVARQGDSYTILFAGADGVVGAGDGRVTVELRGDRVDLDIRLDAGLAGRLEGLLGDGDGDPANDVARADGTVLARPFDYADLYGGFRDDWRVAEASDSLFAYGPGGGPDDAYIPGFPADLVTLAGLDEGTRAAAEAAAEAAGLAPGTANFENAVLDFALTGDRSFIASSLGVPALPEDAAVAVDPGTVVNLGPVRPVIAGGAGRDRLEGTGASEALDGRGGRDILIGGGGGDVLTGGAGGDVFVLARDQAPVRIADWGTGGDRLALDDGLLGLGSDGIDPRAPTLAEAQGVLAEGRVAYDAETGVLAIDADGADGPAGLRTVAVIEGGGDVAISDVLLF